MTFGLLLRPGQTCKVETIDYCCPKFQSYSFPFNHYPCHLPTQPHIMGKVSKKAAPLRHDPLGTQLVADSITSQGNLSAPGKRALKKKGHQQAENVSSLASTFYMKSYPLTHTSIPSSLRWMPRRRERFWKLLEISKTSWLWRKMMTRMMKSESDGCIPPRRRNLIATRRGRCHPHCAFNFFLSRNLLTGYASDSSCSDMETARQNDDDESDEEEEGEDDAAITDDEDDEEYEDFVSLDSSR